MVGGGFWWTNASEPDDAAILHQLQLAEGMVSLGCSDQQCKLEGFAGKCVDGACGRRCGPHHEAWIPAGEHLSVVLWKCRAPGRRFVVEHAAADCVFVPED